MNDGFKEKGEENVQRNGGTKTEWVDGRTNQGLKTNETRQETKEQTHEGKRSIRRCKEKKIEEVKRRQNKRKRKEDSSEVGKGIKR